MCMKGWKSKWIIILFPLGLLAIFLFLITLNNVHTETYDIERFNIAKETIRSPVTIENEQETARKTRETVQAVEDRFSISGEITAERIEYIEEIFDAVSTLEEENKERNKKTKDDSEPVPLTNPEKVQRLKQILSEDIVDAINDRTLAQLVEMPKEERKASQALLVASLEAVLDNGVRTENLESATANVQESIKYSKIDEKFKEVLNDLGKFAVVENSFFDADETGDARKEAASSVEPVVIRAGEVIVREGHTITNEIYEELKRVGVMDKDRNLYPVIGLALFILLICGVITFEMNRMAILNKLDKGTLTAVLFISFIVVTIMKIVSLYTTSGNELFYIVPIATGVLLVKLLINERLAIILAGLYAMLGSIIFNGEIAGTLNMEAGTYFFFSQLAGIFFLINIKDRLAILKSGIGMAIVNMLAVLLFLFLSFEKYTLVDFFIKSGFGIGAAFLSAVLTIGLLPFFEAGLGILSDIKLLQLSSPNQPLLKKILTEAPGTYHHSVMVANLSETACDAVGANGLLARVGSYYHDIGKTVRPHYFIENQVAINNPHDYIPPGESAKIIINHPYDGADMLKKHKLPKEIIDIAKQHHGTTLLKYFYFKEKEGNNNVKESDYRYPGPKPQTKEAAIISICDSVEAAIRSLKEPTEEKIDEIVSAIIQDRVLDGQLDESPLTFEELKIARRTICKALKGIFHSRIQYPTKEEA